MAKRKKDSRKPICRADFIAANMRSGLTYVQAVVAYNATMRLIEEAIQNRTKVNFGNVCSMTPVERKPREVHKHFSFTSEGVKRTNEVFYLGRRIEFKIQVFKRFMDTHTINWF